MATYRISAPDGANYDIDAPDNATPEQVNAVASQHIQSIKPAAPNPTEGMYEGEKLRAGMGRSVDQTLDAITELYLKARGEHSAVQGHEENVTEKRHLDQPLMETGAGKAGYIGGEILQTAIPAAKGIGAVQKAMQGSGKLKQALALLGTSGAIGAGSSALKPVVGDESRALNAAEGFGAGVAGQAAGSAVGAGVKGLVQLSRQARALPKAIQDSSTLGQLADRDTFSGQVVSGIEEKAKSWPLVGAVIKNARQKGVDAWRGNVINKVSPEGFTPQGDTTREVIGNIQDEFSKRYSQALQGTRIAESVPFANRVTKLTSNPTNGLTAEQNQGVQTIVNNYYDHMFGIGQGFGPGATRRITGEQAKEFERFLTAQARQYRKSNVPQAENYANLFEDIESAWTSGYRSKLPLAIRQQLKPLDARYAPFKTVERAATTIGNDMGEFTPSNLLTAAKARTTTPQFARGAGLMQEDADIGRHVFQDKIPNPGTADRNLAAGAAIGLMIDPLSTLGAIGAGGATLLPALATNTGKKLLSGRTQTQMLLKALRADKAATKSGVTIAQVLEGEDNGEDYGP